MRKTRREGACLFLERGSDVNLALRSRRDGHAKQDSTKERQAHGECQHREIEGSGKATGLFRLNRRKVHQRAAHPTGNQKSQQRTCNREQDKTR